jgi:hypothetical protein
MPDFLADMPLIICRELYFMHDGAPAHFSLVAHRCLNRMFPGQWIGRGGPIAWPPCSPDLNPVDDVGTLRDQIVADFETICNMPGIWVSSSGGNVMSS